MSSFRKKISFFSHSTKSLDLKTIIFFLVQNRFLSLRICIQNCTLLYGTCTASARYFSGLRAEDANAHHMYFCTLEAGDSKIEYTPARAGQHIYPIFAHPKSAAKCKTPDAKAIKIIKISDLPVKSKK